MNIKKISPWKFIAVTLAILSIPTMFVFLLERYTTSDEDFCMTCHYKMWGKDFLVHSNIHPDSVRCPQCHAKHSEIIPKNFSAHAERINPNCVRCHDYIFKKEDTEGFKYNVMNIKIPHKFHLQEVGALCTDCHLNIKHDKFRPVTNRPRMDVCFECHEQETTPCSKCHQRGADEILASLPRMDSVERKTCEKCHEGFDTKPIPFYNVEFPHTTHLEQNLPCQGCHSNAALHGQIVKTREECMQCHHQNTQRTCTECHTFERRMRAGNAFSGTIGDPDPMAEAVSCDICHEKILEGHSREDVLETCTMCHEEPGFAEIVDEIQQRTKISIQEIEDLMENVRAVSQGLPESSQHEIEPLIARGEAILTTLKRDRSRGFHNSDYADLLIKEAMGTFDQLFTWEEGKTEQTEKMEQTEQ